VKETAKIKLRRKEKEKKGKNLTLLCKKEEGCRKGN